MALLGLYGPVSYAVSTRAREIGVRMALGSARSGVVGHVAGQGMRLVAAGVAAGLLGAVVTSRLLQARLYEVGPGHASTYVLVAGSLAALALLATWIPARRAASTDPVAVLRAE